ncbi:MAG: hypothetical protein O7E55_08210, partial [Chloroflexi bacterium]|nr:hypothetical protein [Chloroflexota bacterium]
NEDQVYSVNPSEGRGRLLEGMDRTPALLLGGTLLPVSHGVGMAQAGTAAPSAGYCSNQE